VEDLQTINNKCFSHLNHDFVTAVHLVEWDIFKQELISVFHT